MTGYLRAQLIPVTETPATPAAVAAVNTAAADDGPTPPPAKKMKTMQSRPPTAPATSKLSPDAAAAAEYKPTPEASMPSPMAAALANYRPSAPMEMEVKKKATKKTALLPRPPQPNRRCKRKEVKRLGH